MLLIRELRRACGRPSHSSTRAIFNSRMVLGGGWCNAIDLPSMCNGIQVRGFGWPIHLLTILAFHLLILSISVYIYLKNKIPPRSILMVPTLIMQKKIQKFSRTLQEPKIIFQGPHNAVNYNNYKTINISFKFN